MRWPLTIYPDEFDRLSAKVRLPSQDNRDFYSDLRYSIKIRGQGELAWRTSIGICKDSSENKYLYAEWKNHNTGEIFHKIIGDAELDKWYRLEMKITKLNSTELKIEYSVNNIVLAQSIPTDSAILLDHNKIYDSHRYLQAGPYEKTQPSASGKGLFDVVWGVYGDKPSYSLGTQSFSESPSLFDSLFKPLRPKLINKGEFQGKSSDKEKKEII